AQVLRKVGFEIKPGQCLAVLGRNGAGKTTLLKCLMGVLPVTRGRVLIDDTDISAWPSHRRSAAGLAYVPQGREIFSELSVAENMEAAARAHGTLHAPVMDETLALFPILKEMWRRPGGALSGGQQQQLAIARALVTEPSLLILDEPTEGIQPSIVKDIGRAITYLREQGRMAILLVEQYFDFARALADSFAVMERGEIVMAGTGSSMVESNVRRYLTV